MTGRWRSKRISCVNKQTQDEQKVASKKEKKRGECSTKKGRHA